MAQRAEYGLFSEPVSKRKRGHREERGQLLSFALPGLSVSFSCLLADRNFSESIKINRNSISTEWTLFCFFDSLRLPSYCVSESLKMNQ